ncbi:hypothetical protein OHS18_41850 [Amycolatopsis sp. NBC_00355]|uniref:hypothetical protein n=1 Tax=Amycolatopsis sp. NBC_00355 TaxID=2975957 RepID=UPI002E2656E6
MTATLDRHHDAHPNPDPMPDAATALTAGSLAFSDGSVPMTGEATIVPGLALTPAVSGRPLRYTGRWTLTHTGSGLSLTFPASLPYTREAAVWLRGAAVDWTRPYEQIRADDTTRRVGYQLRIAMEHAQLDRRPLVFARTSWVQVPPRWRVWVTGNPTEASYEAWQSVEAVAGMVCTWPDPPYDWMNPDAVIRRDQTSPGWALQCAAHGCTDGHAWYADTVGEHDGTAVDTRTELSKVAAEDGWLAHDRHHWTCPGCTRDHH